MTHQKMARQVLTSTLDRGRLETELDEVVRYFREKDVESCRVLFGFAWGNEYYPGREWNEEKIDLVQLRRKVDEVEARGIGSLGNDDLFMKLAGLEFRFCHECDVHIHFTAPSNDHVEAFFARWQKLGYEPTEWVATRDHGPGKRVR
jgi:hypothetical protein